jgi:hypothetical protein
MRFRSIFSDNQKVMDFMNLSWYYYIDQKKIEFFHSLTIKKVVEDVIIPTLPNVGTALFEVCVEEKQ